MREIVECTVGSVRMVGTHHPPSKPPRADGGPGTPVLVLNPGHVARCGAGDLLALTADELALRGHPVYRFDFPGLGDSVGDLPAWEAEFFRFIQNGGNTDLTLELIRYVEKHSSSAGVVLIGLCGGAVTAAFAADKAKSAVRGIVMLDTDFSLLAPGDEDEAQRDTTAHTGTRSRVSRFARKLGSAQTWLRFLTGENRHARILRPLQGVLLPLVRRLMSRKLPSDANMPLITACRRVVDRGTPILSVTAQGKLREIYVEQVDPVAFGDSRQRNVQRLSIPRTNHVFTAGGAKGILIEEIAKWIDSKDW